MMLIDKFIKKSAEFMRRLNNVIRNVIGHNLVIAYHYSYTICYLTGARTIRVLRRLGKRLARVLIPTGRLLYKAVDFLLLKRIRALGSSIKQEFILFVKGFPLAAQRVRSGYKSSPLTGIKVSLLLPFFAVRRHKKTLVKVFNIATPAAALAALIMTINFWSGMTFALAVEYDGQTLGYITDETVYDNAANLATDRVINPDKSFEVQRTPKLTITVVSKSDIIDEVEVCDKIIESSGDAITEGAGLYIDNKFEGAVQSGSELNDLLNSILSSYENGSKNERSEFIQDVDVVDGLYPISSITPIQDMRKHLTSLSMVDKYYTLVKGDCPILISEKTDMTISELRSLNPDFDKKIFPDVKMLVQKAQPYLRVQVIRTVEYDETIDYKTQTVKDSKQYIGYSAVRTNGIEGKKHIKAEVTLIDGVESARKILDTKVIKKPVDKVVVVGEKRVNNSVSAAGDGITTGRFTWPLPSCRMIYSNYGYRGGGFHSGIDISGNGVYGKPVIAADGGKVCEVSHGGGGYGKYIIVGK